MHGRDLQPLCLPVKPPSASLSRQHRRPRLAELGRAGLLIRANRSGHQRGTRLEYRQRCARVQHVDVQA
jgi:hypothetical protein